MVYIIERFYNGSWQCVRDAVGIPLVYFRKSAAQTALRGLPSGRYRIMKVRD